MNYKTEPLKLEACLQLHTNSVTTSHKHRLPLFQHEPFKDFRAVTDVSIVNRNNTGIHCKSAQSPQIQLFIDSYHFILCGYMPRPESQLSSGQYITQKLKITVTTSC